MSGFFSPPLEETRKDEKGTTGTASTAEEYIPLPDQISLFLPLN